MKMTVRVEPPYGFRDRMVLVFEVAKDDGSYTQTLVPIEFNQKVPVNFTWDGESAADISLSTSTTPT
jgi:hypothetical protein